jgi:predicted PurR-regulated permease PerM
MNTKECVAICVAVIVVGLVFGLLSVVIPITRSLDQLTEVLSQENNSRVIIDTLTFTTKAGDTFEFKNLDATANSRMIDILIGAAVAND